MFNNRKRWFEAWFLVIDNLFQILTLGFWGLDTVGWWFYNCTFTIIRRKYYSIGAQISCWFFNWKWLLKSLLTILTLGRL